MTYYKYFRLVKTSWKFKNRSDKTIYSNDTLYNSANDAYIVMDRAVKKHLSELNKGRNSLDFVADFNSIFDCIIRFWDGPEDYWNVVAYDVYALETDRESIGDSTYYKYRDFFIYPNEKHNYFKIELNERVVAKRRNLKNALAFIDEWHLGFDTRP